MKTKAITTTVKPPSKLVHFEVLLASSPTNMTLTLWKSIKVAWPIFGYLFWHTLAYSKQRICISCYMCKTVYWLLS